MSERKSQIDVIKGLLILLVVIAHYERNTLHDIIFLFHMPLFFIISGFLLKEKRLYDKKYLKDKVKGLMIPYFFYFIIDIFIFRRNYSLSAIISIFWGGRYVAGTYWYITCFLGTLLIFAFLKSKLSDKTCKLLIFIGGCIAVIESHLTECIPLLNNPGVPGNLDVCLIALVYIAIGYYNKELIRRWLYDRKCKYDYIAFLTFVIIILFCYMNYKDGTTHYYFDMKSVYYKELILAILVPCAFGIIIMRILYWWSYTAVLQSIYSMFDILGRVTVPIMFMHVTLNIWKEKLEYGLIAYVLIGIGIPVAFAYLFGRFEIMRKFFGLPDLIVKKGRANR